MERGDPLSVGRHATGNTASAHSHCPDDGGWVGGTKLPPLPSSAVPVLFFFFCFGFAVFVDSRESISAAHFIFTL